MTGRRGARWAEVEPCGTAAAYRRHFRRGEAPCEPCRAAEARRKDNQGPAGHGRAEGKLPVSDRWVETEEAVCEWFRARGWPHAERRGRGKPGADMPLLGMPGLLPEIKAQGVLRSAWLAQHNGAGPGGGMPPGGMPLVIWRPPKFGPATIAKWPVMLSLENVTRLLAGAGYGDG